MSSMWEEKTHTHYKCNDCVLKGGIAYSKVLFYFFCCQIIEISVTEHIVNNNNGHFFSAMFHQQGWAHCTLHDQQKCIH